ncbi:MAG TPA: UDP-N-acetylmuramoyl-L-alanine--D-glutamate ligase [Candidatus Aphodovivens excrementavium]|nr:UDP-N-acetylmuramoyl-L-alanine--D-glutamate ligase [Candidatus Aphodovivens excrementavium]
MAAKKEASCARVRRGEGSLGTVLILGLGKSGTAVAEYCMGLLGSRVAGVYIAAGKKTPESEAFAERVACREVRVAFGDEGVSQLAAEVEGGVFDVCVPSPGIAPHNPLYVHGKELSAQVWGEVEFAWRESAPDARWIAITGTNGKTTTTSLLAHILSTAGQNAVAVGNIGDTCMEAVAKDPSRVFVAEVSSYQLYSTDEFSPDAAVLLNVTPDHLSWHGSFEAYREAKCRVFSHLRDCGRAVAVLDATDDEARAKVREFKSIPEDQRGFAYIPVGAKAGYSADMRNVCGSVNAAFVDADGTMTVAYAGKEHRLCKASELQIKGRHNVGNALAAASVAVALGSPDEAVAEGLRSFEPLAHRIEPCGSVQGVRCYNDSKATNVDASLAAIAAFPETRPILLFGGDDKGTDLSPLIEASHRHARAAVCFGAAGERFYQAFADAQASAPEDFAVLRAGNMEDALDVAFGIARSGEVIVLSPACASFDEFSCFEERGEVFKRLVASRARRLGA